MRFFFFLFWILISCQKTDKSRYENVFEESSIFIVSKELISKYIEFPKEGSLIINSKTNGSDNYIKSNHFYDGNWPLKFKYFLNFKPQIKAERDFFNRNSPIILQDKIIINQENGLIKCFDSHSKREIWQYDLSEGLRENLDYFYSSFSYFMSTDSEYIISNSNLGKILLINAKNGKKIWSKEHNLVISDLPAECDKDTCFFVSNNGSVFALDVKSGEIKWSYKDLLNSSLSYSYFQERRFLIEKDSLIYSDNNGQVLSLDKRDGKVLWKTNFSYFSQKDADVKYFNAISISNNKILIGSSHSLGISFGVDLISGSIKWVQPFGISSDILVLDNFTIGISEDNTLICFDNLTGGIKWTKSLELRKKYELPKYLNNGKNLLINILYKSPLIINGDIILSNYFGEFYRFDLQSGDLIGKYEVPIFISGLPVLFEGKIYLQTILGTLYESI